MKDQAAMLNFRVAIKPQVQTNDNTAIVGEIIDRLGYESLTFAIATGIVTDANVTTVVLVEDGDDSGLSDAAAVADANLAGTELLAAFTFADDTKCKKIGYVGNKRYVRVTVTPTSNDAGALPIAAVAVLGTAHVGMQPNPPV